MRGTLPATYELGDDKLYGHVKPRKTRARFLEFCRYIIWRNNHADDERLPPHHRPGNRCPKRYWMPATGCAAGGTRLSYSPSACRTGRRAR